MATTPAPLPKLSAAIRCHAAMQRNGPITPWTFKPREMRDRDVVLDVLYCGICHTDLHCVGPWRQEFPLVPGHDMVGRVMTTGKAAARFKPGDIVAVSVIVDSCRECEPCKQGLETYCQGNPTATYDGIDRVDGSRTRGGFAHNLMCDEHFVYAVPEGLPPAGVAPLLCAGITTYAPLRHWKVGPGKTVGIVGCRREAASERHGSRS